MALNHVIYVRIVALEPNTVHMVKVSTEKDKNLYQCEECGFHYADDSTSLITGKEWAEKCEAWCRERQSCNLEITAQAEENKTS